MGACLAQDSNKSALLKLNNQLWDEVLGLLDLLLLQFSIENNQFLAILMVHIINKLEGFFTEFREPLTSDLSRKLIKELHGENKKLANIKTEIPAKWPLNNFTDQNLRQSRVLSQVFKGQTKYVVAVTDLVKEYEKHIKRNRTFTELLAKKNHWEAYTQKQIEQAMVLAGLANTLLKNKNSMIVLSLQQQSELENQV